MQKSEKSFAGKSGRVGVLLIHGLCGSPSEIRFVANGLTRNGYTVLCPQLAGHGGTEADLMATTWQDWYESAEKGLEELSATCETVIVGGLSTGAVLSLMLAERHPDKVHAVALYSPTLWLSGRQIPWYLPLFRLIDSKWVANLFRFPVPIHVGIKDQRIRDFIRNAMASEGSKVAPVSTPGGAVLERRRLAKVVMKSLNRISQPVLILHAREDDYAGLDNAAYLQRELAGPVDLVVLDDSYHMVTVDRQRHVVLDRTTAFVSRIAGSITDSIRAKPAAQLRVVGGLATSAA
ncbi:alpha/beta fold hydrolase [Hyphomicrobium sp. LHD-15]|uniref:alpha/beta hydrolase n=1 Tax=Hyphomicrobium sp. LHD-15 TaxID=3072142 RepID=UPI00280E1AB5|nr:alpha/beta fold hydrolase [Hyphomicrobium sp. LHD-15]MDQ8697751.1 alpha/beta fold hydrolase [Hyphomicrobium sp. LHD-15]